MLQVGATGIKIRRQTDGPVCGSYENEFLWLEIIGLFTDSECS
jgi:hypothetical protein